MAELATGLVDGGLGVAEALVGFGAGVGGDVGLFELHLAELGTKEKANKGQVSFTLSRKEGV